jgi:hypothetical protein
MMEMIGSYFYFLCAMGQSCVVDDRDGGADRDMLQAGTSESPQDVSVVSLQDVSC